jgi:6-phosphofructokinase 1
MTPRNTRYAKSEEERQIDEDLADGRRFETGSDRLRDVWSKRVHNPIPEPERGPSLGPDDRRAVTADLNLLERLRKTSRGRMPGFLAAGPRETLHFDPASVRVAIVTPGGVCPGLNTVIDEIVRRHWLYSTKRPLRGSPGPALLGVPNGYRGFVDQTGDVPFAPLTPYLTESWPRRGGSMLRTVREQDETWPDAESVVETLRRSEIDILYVAGGDGSLQKALAIKAIADRDHLNIGVVHIPKTMDNDIPWISESFGFQTAIAEAARLVNAIRDEAQSNNRIGIVEVMGAGVGHTAAHTALASGEIDVVLIPEEQPIDFAKVIDHIHKRAFGVRGKGYAVILAAEKVEPDLELAKGDGSAFVKELNERFMMAHAKARVFVNRPMHFIRAVPANCKDQVYCRQLANCAADCALAGYTGFSISKWLDEFVMIPFVRYVRHAGQRRPKHLPLDGPIWKQVMNLTGQPEFRRG